MKRILALALAAVVYAGYSSFASTNLLYLFWPQPPGYTSVLYSSTNLDGNWSEMAVNPNPIPYPIHPTNPVTYFWVSVTPPPSTIIFTGGDDGPFSISNAPTGSLFIGTNIFQLWLKRDDGWFEGVGP